MKKVIWITVAMMVCGASSLAFGDWSVPVPVTKVNTQYTDFDSFLSFDGKTLYFARQNTATFYYSRLLAATRDAAEGTFTQVTELSDLNYFGHVESPWVSADNLRMYYYRSEPGNDWKVLMTERASVNDSWQQGSYIPGLNQFDDISKLSLSENELTVVFTRLQDPDDWKKDLWVATRSSINAPFGGYTPLTALNTLADDGSPYLSPDGLTLYYATGYQNGGNYRIFKSERASLLDPFGPGVHMAAFDTLNGSSRSPALSSDGTTMYFTSNLAENPNQKDIYVSYIPEPVTFVFLSLGMLIASRNRKLYQ